ncbi:XrtB/PEP-CTERM-associated polysaccharide biosynthesis outer membrane protein EpsL [Niveibacterium sp.]|uniref:XrtB/PEP-CTERM-associated polysaccharide biosynthesis outer membrane protein EpsL n=1 Tax=Niveibacterium sp. TaxID=2017444 RepID=UPI0035AE766E
MNLSSKKFARYGLVSFLSAMPLVLTLTAQAEDPTPLRYGAGMTFQRDSNLFRLDSETPGGVQSDNITNGYAYLGFDTTLSRQRLYGNFNFGKTQFSRFSQLDYDKQDIKAGWDGDFPGQIRTGLTWTHTAQLANFADLTVPRRNLITRDAVRLDLDVPVIANWHIVAAGAANQARNSNTLDRGSDLDGRTVEGGIRYVTPYGNRLDVVGQQTNVGYIERTATPFSDSAYRERSASLRAMWAVSGASRLEGNVGYLERRNENFSNRDFSGPNFRVAWTWEPAGSTVVAVTAYRTMGSAGDNEFDAAATKALRIAPTWDVTGKLSLNAQVEAGQRRYIGSIFEGLPIEIETPGREDDFQSWGLGLRYAALRWLLIDIGYRGERRDSNRYLRDYDDHTGTVTVQIGF